MGFLGDFEKLGIDSSDEEIISFIKQASNGQIVVTTEKQALYVNYALNLLNLKRQEKLISGQNDFNRKQLIWNGALAIATWVLAIATIILVFVTK